MLVLGIETSCDETGVALYDAKRGLLAQALHSQVLLHQPYGGVVPEVASRDHQARLLGLVNQVMNEAAVIPTHLSAIAYTAGPGLVGALLIGAGFAEGLAYALKIPALPIHHLEGHLLSPLLLPKPPTFPFLALLVSGAHTQIMEVKELGNYRLLGESLDDAAGEAFDKTARLLELPYPGGPALENLAKQGKAGTWNLPRPMIHSNTLDFSFAGLKTAVALKVKSRMLSTQEKADLAFEFQQAVSDVLCGKIRRTISQTGLKNVVVSGGVAANKAVRESLKSACASMGAKTYFPPVNLCTDNGAMIALAGCLHLLADPQRKVVKSPPNGFSVHPRYPLQRSQDGDTAFPETSVKI